MKHSKKKKFKQNLLVSIPKKHTSRECKDHMNILLPRVLRILTRIIYYYRIKSKKFKTISRMIDFSFREGTKEQERIAKLRLIIEKAM